MFQITSFNKVTKTGEVVPEELWRRNIMKKERIDFANKIIGEKIVREYESILKHLIKYLINLSKYLSIIDRLNFCESRRLSNSKREKKRR